MKFDTRLTLPTLMLGLIAVAIPFTANWNLPLLNGVVVEWIERPSDLHASATYRTPVSMPIGDTVTGSPWHTHTRIRPLDVHGRCKSSARPPADAASRMAPRTEGGLDPPGPLPRAPPAADRGPCALASVEHRA